MIFPDTVSKTDIWAYLFIAALLEGLLRGVTSPFIALWFVGIFWNVPVFRWVLEDAKKLSMSESRAAIHAKLAGITFGLWVFVYLFQSRGGVSGMKSSGIALAMLTIILFIVHFLVWLIKEPIS